MPPIDFSQRHYESVAGPRQPGGDHPVDKAVATVREVREIDARARVQSRRMRRSGVRANHAEWVRYADLLLAQRCIRQERFFDAGFQHGLLAGRADPLPAPARGAARRADRQVSRLASDLRLAVMGSPLSREAVIVILLELARALLLDAAAQPAPDPAPAA